MLRVFFGFLLSCLAIVILQSAALARPHVPDFRYKSFASTDFSARACSRCLARICNPARVPVPPRQTERVLCSISRQRSASRNRPCSSPAPIMGQCLRLSRRFPMRWPWRWPAGQLNGRRGPASIWNRQRNSSACWGLIFRWPLKTRLKPHRLADRLTPFCQKETVAADYLRPSRSQPASRKNTAMESASQAGSSGA